MEPGGIAGQVPLFGLRRMVRVSRLNRRLRVGARLRGWLRAHEDHGHMISRNQPPMLWISFQGRNQIGRPTRTQHIGGGMVDPCRRSKTRSSPKQSSARLCGRIDA